MRSRYSAGVKVMRWPYKRKYQNSKKLTLATTKDRSSERRLHQSTTYQTKQTQYVQLGLGQPVLISTVSHPSDSYRAPEPGRLPSSTSLQKENSLAERGVPPTKGRVSSTCTLTPLNRPAKDDQQTQPTLVSVIHPLRQPREGADIIELNCSLKPTLHHKVVELPVDKCTQSRPSKDYSGTRLVAILDLEVHALSLRLVGWLTVLKRRFGIERDEESLVMFAFPAPEQVGKYDRGPPGYFFPFGMDRKGKSWSAARLEMHSIIARNQAQPEGITFSPNIRVTKGTK
ncbi:hypothetical protein CPB83DRAFT_834254 [Crepidotus variabilis]|uniref:Uncharacterized protein n=1 Tax=Crepidotus variabilis TaxID=179855 RepID=A0A9P6EK64_9AGAR|nr:hypothetical protein CPB83DRAFT_834254 [Crepidotus variabilis]